MFYVRSYWIYAVEFSPRVALGENKVLVASSLYPAPKGATYGFFTGWNCHYAFTTHQEPKTSLNFFIGMLKLFSHGMYCLLDLGLSLYYVTLFVAVYFGCGLDCLQNSFFPYPGRRLCGCHKSLSGIYGSCWQQRNPGGINRVWHC